MRTFRSAPVSRVEVHFSFADLIKARENFLIKIVTYRDCSSRVACGGLCDGILSWPLRGTLVFNYSWGELDFGATRAELNGTGARVGPSVIASHSFSVFVANGLFARGR